MSFEDRLSASIKQAAAAAPLEPLSLGATLARGRHERRKMMAIAVGVAAVVIALGAFGANALTGSRVPPPRPVPPAGSTEPATPTPSPTDEASPTEQIEGVVDPEARAIEASRAWIAAISQGDAKSAYELMNNPLTGKARLPRAEFEAFLAEGASEGLGGYAAAADPVFAFVPLGGSSGEAVRGVFMVRGDVMREGSTELDAFSFPMTVVPEGAFVDLGRMFDVMIAPEQPTADPDGGGNVVGGSFVATARLGARWTSTPQPWRSARCGSRRR